MRAACVRIGLFLALAATATPVAPAPANEFIQAVEFPYYLYPRALWERELVWIKNLGVRTVEFPVPSEWHQQAQGGFDLTGSTSPRRDLVGFVRLMRRLGLRAWIRPSNAGVLQAGWQKALQDALATQTASHGGPIAYVEDSTLGIDAAEAPSPVVKIAAGDPKALLRSRETIAGAKGALLWTDVEDKLYPAGWPGNSGPLLHKGAVGIDGEQRQSVAPLRRDAALLRNWSPVLATFQPVAMPKPAAGKLAAGVTAVELTSQAASAISITNQGTQPFHDDLRVIEPISKRTLAIPNVTVGPGESLWLPLAVSLGQKGLCKECTNFSTAERIVYATAELLAIEYENGILAMEFTAPEEGEVILQLEREPVGPYLAAGKPTKFEWDDKALRARLQIPANRNGDHRMRIGLAMEEPETSAFFNDARRLIVGQKNVLSTTYSSSDVAARSRLRLPEGYTATAKPRAGEGIDYEIAVPADAVPGDYANLAIEADGMLLGRARLPLFSPATIRINEAMKMHFGHTEVAVDPPTAVVEPRGGSNLEVAIGNNWPIIQTFRLEAAGSGLEFFPPKQEISIGAMDQRKYLLRVFAGDGVTGSRDWRLKVTGAASADMPMRLVVLPRGRTVVWSADLDGDGSAEWIIESQKARAMFSSQDGGRWIEFTSKETAANFLPDEGAFAAAGPVDVKAAGDKLEISGRGWKRTVSLTGGAVTIEQTGGLPADGLTPGKSFSIERQGTTRAVYKIE
jgi:hypothetical protein